jgi:hypothetical protein
LDQDFAQLPDADAGRNRFAGDLASEPSVRLRKLLESRLELLEYVTAPDRLWA